MIILPLWSPLPGWLLKYSGRVIPLLVMHRILAAPWLRAALSPRFGEAAKRVLALIRCTELFLSLARVTVLALFDCFRPKFPHHVTVLPRVSRRPVRRGMVRAGALEYLIIIVGFLPL